MQAKNIDMVKMQAKNPLPEEIPIPPDLSAPLPAAPEQLVASGSRDGTQEIREGREEEGGTATDRGVDPQ
jgi:hypothetical protein